MDPVTLTLTIDRYHLMVLIDALTDYPDLSDLRLQLTLAYASHHNQRIDALADTLPPSETSTIKEPS